MTSVSLRDLPVKDDLDRPVLVADWLISARQVDDGQSAVDQADTRLHPETFRVRSTVGDAVAHGLQNRPLNRRIGIIEQDSSDAAHYG
jgi:hypothetical protein